MTSPTRAALIREMAIALIDADPAMAGHHETHITAKLPYAEAALIAIEAAGCRVVPVEATAEMRGFPQDDLVDYSDFVAVWEVMVSCSPYAPEAEG